MNQETKNEQKNEQLRKQLQFHCWKCQTIYQLIEVHSQVQPKCPDNCSQKWQAICHEYYNEKVLSYIAKQEEENGKKLEERDNYDWINKSRK